MPNKYKFLLASILCLCLGFQSIAQMDTVYVYEDVVVYDTIVVYDTVFVKHAARNLLPVKPKSISILHLDTVNHYANLILISDKQTATFSIDAIIVEKNINNSNSIKMKKITFMTLLGLSFKTMVMAQSTVGITVGNNLWVNSPQDEIGFSPKVSYIAPQIGGYVSTKLTNNLDLRIDAQYSYAVSNNKTTTSNSTVDAYFYTSNYYQFRIPVHVVLNTGKLKPAIGLYYGVSKASEKYTDKLGGLLHGGEVNDKYSLYLSQFGGSLGAYYELTDRWGVSLNYLVGISIPNLKFTTKKEGVYGGDYTNVQPRSHQINAGLTYRFGAKK